MKVACPACKVRFEVWNAPRKGASAPLCDACATAAKFGFVEATLASSADPDPEGIERTIALTPPRPPRPEGAGAREAERPIFFDVEALPPPRHERDASRSSGFEDLRSLAARTSSHAPRSPDADLLDLHGGLFTPPPRSQPESVAPGPLVAEKKSVDPTARRDLASWALAVAALTATTFLIGERFSAALKPEHAAAPAMLAAEAAPAHAAPTPTHAAPATSTSAPVPTAVLAPSPAPSIPALAAHAPEAPAAAPSLAAEPAPRVRAEPKAKLAHGDASRREPSAGSGDAPAAPDDGDEHPAARVMVERMAAIAPRPSASAPPGAAALAAPEFDRDAARASLAIAAGTAVSCRSPGDPAGTGKVAITFAPSGRVQSALVMGAPFQATRTGACIAAAFRGASVPAFSGGPVMVTREVTVR